MRTHAKVRPYSTVTRWWAMGLLLAPAMLPALACAQSGAEWPVHSMSRPKPPIIAPPPVGAPVPPPGDALLLFDAVDIVPGRGNIQTDRAFGDVQLHIEWMAPAPPRGDGQGRGNSGVFLMGRYEVQVLDSYRNETYADGQAASIYGQYPPLVNASRPPGEWQAYDIVFRRPRFRADGSVADSARMTVFHNGVLVQDHVALHGATAHMVRAKYEAHADRLPLVLQDHGDPVRFRNVWVRDLEAATTP